MVLACFNQKLMMISSSQLSLIPNSIFWAMASWRIDFLNESMAKKKKKECLKNITFLCNENKLSRHLDKTFTKDHPTEILQIWKNKTMLHTFPHISRLHLPTSAPFAHVKSHILQYTLKHFHHYLKHTPCTCIYCDQNTIHSNSKVTKFLEIAFNKGKPQVK